jgi:seryl-tRNA synthetase
MDPSYKFPGSPGTPLLQISPERVNQQKNESGASPSIGAGGHSRDSSVYEKVAKFDSLASQSKALERKANDAALKRAMVGREEAETDMRRYREEVRTLRKQVEEGNARERKVGERLETVMVSF